MAVFVFVVASHKTNPEVVFFFLTLKSLEDIFYVLSDWSLCTMLN